MPREKKEAKNFACKFDKEIFERLEEFCQLSRQNKTAVVERAVEKYLEENLEKMREFRDAIADYDEGRIAELIHEANRIKKIIR